MSFSGKSSKSWFSVLTRIGLDSKAQNAPYLGPDCVHVLGTRELSENLVHQEPIGELGAGSVTKKTLKDGAHVDPALACPEARLQHSADRQHQLAVEWSYETIFRLALRPRMKPDVTWVGYRNKAAHSLRKGL